jgi:vacuolar-type H+-ATPase subunit C/Vma6
MRYAQFSTAVQYIATKDCIKVWLGESEYITLIRFGKFEEITVLMEKTCNFDTNLSDFNSVDLKKTQKNIKGQLFSKAKKFKFYDFSVIWVSLRTIVQKKSLV